MPIASSFAPQGAPRPIRVSALTVCGCAAALTFAATLAAPGAAHAQGLEQVVVTAPRPPEPVGQAAFSVVTLNAASLSQNNRLDAALAQVPGLSLFRRTTSISSNPTTDGVSLREIGPSGAGRALVLLDGVPLNDPFGNWVIWTALPFEDIGQAEIVRGAGAGPYGAGALTGTISLAERDTTNGIAVADVSGGSLGTVRAGMSGGTTIGHVGLFASISGEHSNGWIPVLPPQRGAADRPLWFNGGSASLRAQTPLGGDVVLSERIEAYDQAQGNGLEQGKAGAKGLIGSVTLARKANDAHFGWRLQAWTLKSNLTNMFVSVPPDRSSAKPVNDQYATPALGWGWNAAAVSNSGPFRWEVGADMRDDSGESRERYFNLNGVFQNNRRAGGRLIVGGLYAEGAYDTGTWLLTAGVRGDEWATSQGHLVQTKRATGAVLLANYPKSRNGIVPTGRVAARRNFNDGEYLRVAAYAGFRPASLNELYRPYRVGNNTTEANAALVPEKLYGAEVGWGGHINSVSWGTTLFWNRLHDAITNVTIGSTNGGTLYQRQNAGNIDALGFEGDVTKAMSDNFSLRAAIALTDAKVHAHGAAAQLNGKRPAQAPFATITGGAVWRPLPPVDLAADLRWISMQYEDDLNTLKLGSAFTLDLRAAWRFRSDWSAYVALNNATDAKVATKAAVDGIIDYNAPRTVSVGITYAPSM